MKRQLVESSMAGSVGYDPLTLTLEVEFRKTGDVWQYYEVPEKVFFEMMSGSIGSYFMENIKGQYPESQVR